MNTFVRACHQLEEIKIDLLFPPLPWTKAYHSYPLGDGEFVVEDKEACHLFLMAIAKIEEAYHLLQLARMKSRWLEEVNE